MTNKRLETDTETVDCRIAWDVDPEGRYIPGSVSVSFQP